MLCSPNTSPGEAYHFCVLSKLCNIYIYTQVVLGNLTRGRRIRGEIERERTAEMMKNETGCIVRDGNQDGGTEKVRIDACRDI